MPERLHYLCIFCLCKVCFYHLENPFKWPAAAAAGKPAVPESAQMLEVRFQGKYLQRPAGGTVVAPGPAEMV